MLIIVSLTANRLQAFHSGSRLGGQASFPAANPGVAKQTEFVRVERPRDVQTVESVLVVSLLSVTAAHRGLR